MSTNKEDLIVEAKFAEQEERFDDMASAMKAVSEKEDELTTEDRDLLSVAYKNAIETRRSSWTLISSIGQMSENSDSIQQVAKEYQDKVEKEITDICHEILGLLDTHLIPKAKNAESKVFYLKMKGDYNRYLAEVSTGETRNSITENSQKAYQEAFEIAKAELAPADPTRLSLVLNFSVFFFEILNLHDTACQIANQALEDANKELGELNDESKESNFVMQLLRENITLWTKKTGGDACEQQESGDNESGVHC